MDFDPESIAKSPFVVGGAGAFIAAWKFAAPGTGAIEKGLNTISGALAAGFLSPPLCTYLKMTTPEYIGGAAFVTGVLSMSIVAAVIGAIRDIKWADIASSWFTRR
jgi:hypothetical protein